MATFQKETGWVWHFRTNYQPNDDTSEVQSYHHTKSDSENESSYVYMDPNNLLRIGFKLNRNHVSSSKQLSLNEIIYSK